MMKGISRAVLILIGFLLVAVSATRTLRYSDLIPLHQINHEQIGEALKPYEHASKEEQKEAFCRAVNGTILELSLLVRYFLLASVFGRSNHLQTENDTYIGPTAEELAAEKDVTSFTGWHWSDHGYVKCRTNEFSPLSWEIYYQSFMLGMKRHRCRQVPGYHCVDWMQNPKIGLCSPPLPNEKDCWKYHHYALEVIGKCRQTFGNIETVEGGFVFTDWVGSWPSELYLENS